jgi:phosphoenolpyruvate carboxylase
LKPIGTPARIRRTSRGLKAGMYHGIFGAVGRVGAPAVPAVGSLMAGSFLDDVRRVTQENPHPATM